MLEARNITVGYGSREAIAGISVCVKPKQITAIIGPNGAGKTTLLRTLNGAIEPMSGDVLLDSMPLSAFARRVIARRIAVVAQEAELRFPVTVFEFVLGGRYAWANSGAWGWETFQDIEAGETALRETRLEAFASRVMSELSGGERQRAVLARALATEATILLLDEPTANLDLAHQAAVLDVVRSHCDERGAGAIVVTHDINLAAEFADQVLLIKDGHAIASGRPRDVLTRELLSEVFEIQVLVDSHPVSGVPRITPVHEAKRRS